MVDKQAIADKNFAKITEITRSAVQKMLGFELLHVGVNCADADEAMKVAKRFGAIFGWPVKDGNSSTFSGTAVECMKKPYLGKNGHIAIGTTSVLRAKAYLESMGFEFDESTAKYNGREAQRHLPQGGDRRLRDPPGQQVNRHFGALRGFSRGAPFSFGRVSRILKSVKEVRNA